MNRARAIALLVIILFASIIVLQTGAFEAITPSCAGDTTTDTARLSDEIHDLDNRAQDLLSSAQSTYNDMANIALLANPNRPLSGGDISDIESRLDLANSQVNEHQNQLYDMKQDVSRLSAELDQASLPASETSGLGAAISRIENNLALVESTLERIRTLRGSVNVGRL